MNYKAGTWKKVILTRMKSFVNINPKKFFLVKTRYQCFFLSGKEKNSVNFPPYICYIDLLELNGKAFKI